MITLDEMRARVNCFCIAYKNYCELQLDLSLCLVNCLAVRKEIRGFTKVEQSLKHRK